MGNMQSIEKAIEAMPPAELAEFRRWFAEFDAAAWDRQIEADASAGGLDTLAAEALADHGSGSVRELRSTPHRSASGSVWKRFRQMCKCLRGATSLS